MNAWLMPWRAARQTRELEEHRRILLLTLERALFRCGCSPETPAAAPARSRVTAEPVHLLRTVK